MARSDHGGTGWQVGRSLSDERLAIDGLEADLFFVLIARRIHGLKFDYSESHFKSMKSPVKVKDGSVEFTIPAYLHLMSADGGYGGI